MACSGWHMHSCMRGGPPPPSSLPRGTIHPPCACAGHGVGPLKAVQVAQDLVRQGQRTQQVGHLHTPLHRAASLGSGTAREREKYRVSAGAKSNMWPVAAIGKWHQIPACTPKPVRTCQQWRRRAERVQPSQHLAFHQQPAFLQWVACPSREVVHIPVRQGQCDGCGGRRQGQRAEAARAQVLMPPKCITSSYQRPLCFQ